MALEDYALPRVTTLLGRDAELNALGRLLYAVTTGASRALVLRGEPGIGKSALLEHLAGHAGGCRVIRASGVQSEVELAFAGLHQLCAPLLACVERIPEPQQQALRTAFGLQAGRPPDRLLVGLSVLSLLSEAAEERPLVCLVDDVQWLDRSSTEALAFVARRLQAESLALVFAARDSGAANELAGLPELTLGGLRDADARTLLRSVTIGPLDQRVLDRIVAETSGNPLALLELPRGVTPAELAGGFVLPDVLAVPGQIEHTYERRLASLPPDTRRLLLIAAADSSGDSGLVLRAAERLGLSLGAIAPGREAGLLAPGPRVQLKHPLVRSAIYRAATPEARRDAHQALADVTDPDLEPDRRAWHRAQAAPRPDEAVASELERCALRARARGGHAAAAAFLERTVALTLDPARQAERGLAAAEAKHLAGAPDASLALLAAAEAGPLDEVQRARAARLRGQVAYVLSRGRDAPSLLIEAARRLEPFDAGLARDTYRDAFTAAWYAGALTRAAALPEVARAAHDACSAQRPAGPSGDLLESVALLITDGYATGAPRVRRSLRPFLDASGVHHDQAGWLGFACRAAHDIWDDAAFELLATRFVAVVRDAGALSVLPFALSIRSVVHVFAGEFDAATSLLSELRAVVAAMGGERSPYADVALAAMRGQEAETGALIDAVTADARARGEGQWFAVAAWARSVLNNGLGRYDAALSAAEEVLADPAEITVGNWALPELIEAAARSGRPERARQGFEQLRERTGAAGNDWGLGLASLSQALLTDGAAAEGAYREAVDRLGRTRVAVHRSRAHLAYGEWLRREGRRPDAREHLLTAHESFAAIGMEAFAQRAARELLATGVTARNRAVNTLDVLTAQEAEIARLAGDGLSNPEIGGKLFISPRTVQYHLRKVFAKLNVGSRGELARVLGSERDRA